ncbi:TPA: hypothetical protein ACNRRD_001897 [Pseudomonas aeruginosa]|uniref:hypothetical protein n=1 Tax=Pseudomonas aeruginosa TaxID=287 RepID=UPI0003D33D67|nr:hypothetical protein [Pseudomonas aeruginosa]ETD94764.1 hypothetical protein V527_01855 [Pseudomonas aeruginosa VRFPA06]MBO8290105.1 hypothetical protein [Pseudomonas aeruginosa]MBR7200987.1 hypothetical protein [Pseudomonas aeruginosa]MDG3610762.1 hypothetical protein [Pseudomonas aeruginosa]MDG3612816.1 hypothetical protein [Pseudomonas aeruginosa]
MTDHAELRRLAEACDVSRCADEGEERRRLHDFYDCVEPELILDLLDEIDRLKAENEALRKDAERYRWLRGASHFDTPQHKAFCKTYGDALDCEIDAALEGATQ